jgi:hypothetical protein
MVCALIAHGVRLFRIMVTVQSPEDGHGGKFKTMVRSPFP